MNEQDPQLPKKDVTYCTVKFSVGWLPGSVGFTEQAKSALAAAMGLDKKVVRGSYAILGAGRDPLIKEGASLKRLLTTIRDEFTIPEYTLRATAGGDDAKPEKIKGSHLIESIKVEEFLKRFTEARDQYLAWGKRVTTQENYERIRDADRDSLGKDWTVVEKKYPSAAAIADGISCDIPKVEPFDASFTLADVAPETARQLREQAESRLNASVEGATAELVLEFKAMVEAVARNCGKRVRLVPPKGSHEDIRHAEVTQILRHEDEPDVPEGSMLVTVQPVSFKGDKMINRGKTQDMLLTEEEYQKLRPYETDEHRQLTQSSFDNLLWLAKKISTVKSMLGEEGESGDLTALAQEVESTLRDLGKSASDITKQLKDSSFARKTAKQTFTSFLDRLKTQEIQIKQRSKVRRKITPKGK